MTVKANTTNTSTSVVSNVTIGEPYIGDGPAEKIDPPLPVLDAKKKRPHFLDGWVKHFNPATLQMDLSEELERRGLVTAADLAHNPNAVVAALQRVLGIDAAKIINLALEAKQDGK